MAKRIKQINNLIIKQDTAESIQFFNHSSTSNPNFGKYSVWTPNGKCWEDGLTLAQAEEFCKETTDYITRGLK